MTSKIVQKQLERAERIFLIFSFVILATASILSFILPPETRTIIPHPEITIPFVNTLCAALSFIAIFKISWKKIQYAILFIEAVCTILTGYELLGIFLYSALLIKLFSDGFFINHFYLKLTILLLIWLSLILGLIPFGTERMILSYAAICFFCAFYYHIYKKMKNALANYLPPSMVDSEINLPEPGNPISLSDYNLSNRQKEILSEYLKYGTSYKNLAQKFIVSESTVKTEMARIQKHFGVKNREDLRVLLLQYELK